MADSARIGTTRRRHVRKHHDGLLRPISNGAVTAERRGHQVVATDGTNTRLLRSSSGPRADDLVRRIVFWSERVTGGLDEAIRRAEIEQDAVYRLAALRLYRQGRGPFPA